MRNRIIGIIGMVWGALILLNRLLGGQPGAQPGGAYAAGQSMAVIFGLLLLVVGAYYVFKKPAA